MFRLFNDFMVMAPEGDSGGGGKTIEPGGLSKEDMINFLSDDTTDDVIELDPDKKPKKPSKQLDDEDEIHAEEDDTTDTEDEEEEVDDLDEIEKELEGPSEEELEVVTPVRRREILKKYPQLFKDFPYLEKAYYREQQFTEIFPTIVDAKESSEKSRVLDMFEKDVIQGGNTEKILAAVKGENPEAFLKLVDNYLPTLAKIDTNAYHHILGNVHKYTIHAMVREARSNKNEELEKAAAMLNQFIFGNTTYTPPSKLSKETSQQNDQQSEETKKQKEFVQGRFETTRDDLNVRVNNTLRNTIETHIDPKKSMSDYIRKNAVKDASENLTGVIRQDRRFMTLLDKLWDDAFKKNFNQESTDRIKTAYLSKAKTLLPSVIKKARNEALRGMGKRVKDDDSDMGESETRQNPTVKNEQPRSKNNSGKIKSGKDIPRKMSTLEFLNSD